ncbi:hypothetical protein [Amycolatopsis sp. CA-126428]|nr:hypothetical protein [Amycolatopsis sp. CA-126428]
MSYLPEHLRLWLEAHDAGHVPATKVNDTPVTTGRRPRSPGPTS